MDFKQVPRKRRKTNIGRIRLEYYGLDYINRILKSGRRRMEIPGSCLPDFYKGKRPPTVSLHRMELFFIKGLKCVHCNLEAKYYAVDLERRGYGLHMDLYGVDAEGDEVMLTRDHIHPRSKGGSDDISNLQPMCKICNEFKSDKLVFQESHIEFDSFKKVEILTELMDLVTVKYIDSPIFEGHKLWFDRAADKDLILDRFGTTSFQVIDVGQTLIDSVSPEQTISIIVKPLEIKKAL